MLFSKLETTELNLPIPVGNDAKWVKYTEAAKLYANQAQQEPERSIEEKIGNALDSMLQDDSRGQVFVFRREKGALIPQEVSPDAVDLENLSQYEMIVVDGGNSAGDLWKQVFFLSSEEPKSFFLSEN